MNRKPSQLPPNGLDVKKVPQLMSFAFDDNAYSGYEESGAKGGMKFIFDTFESFKNPQGKGNKNTFDGEKYKVTLYFKGNNAIKNDREDDSLVKKIVHEGYERGHEIGCHTFTHPEGLKFDWDTEPPQRIDNLFLDDWLKEMNACINLLTKPYNPVLLLLRISAVMRRMAPANDKALYRGAEVDFSKGTIEKDGMKIVLTKNEMIIFQQLLSHLNQIVSRDDIMTNLWDNDEFINDNALTVSISRLRAKLVEAGFESTIETRKKLGYILQG